MGSSLSWRELSDLPRSEICDAFEMAGWRGRKKAERLFNVGLESFQRENLSLTWRTQRQLEI